MLLHDRRYPNLTFQRFAAGWLVGLVVATSLLHPDLTQAQPRGFMVDAVFGSERLPGQFNRPSGVAVDSQDRIIVADTANHRIQVCDAQGICTAFGRFESAPPCQFNFPSGVAVDSQDRIIVADTYNYRIQACEAQGTCTAFGSLGNDPGQFTTIGGVAVDSQDRIIVADYNIFSLHEFRVMEARIQVCDAQGACTAFGRFESAPPCQFNFPSGVAVDSQDRIIVADTYNYRIQVCEAQGICKAFGNFGSDPGQFSSPSGVAVDSRNRIIVADKGNDRIQVCGPQWACTVFGSPSSAPGQFSSPSGVAVDSQNRIIVVDRSNHPIQVCDDQGICEAFGVLGKAPGQFDHPSGGGAVNSQDRIIVADTRNHRIQILIVSASLLGSPSYCRVNGLCGVGEGDCDGGHECQAGLVCVNDVGAQYGFRTIVDVCVAPSGGAQAG